MQTLPREDFPTPAGRWRRCDATLPRDVGEGDGRETQFAITGEDTRFYLNGALFILRADSMSLVATDGHRLALVTVDREAEGRRRTKARSARSSQEDAAELSRLLTEGEGDVNYERGENHLFFEVGGRLLISRMIDGQFPAYERVIPKATTSTSSSSAIA